MKRQISCLAFVFVIIIGPNALGARTAQLRIAPYDELEADGTAGSTATPAAAAHETARGVFIDPLITEHAYVDRKVRVDFAASFLREEAAGELYSAEQIFEYAFTRWFSLELAQPVVFTSPSEGTSAAGLGDLSIGAKFQLTRADEFGGVILSAGLESSLPSGETDVSAGEEYVVAPLAGVDWAIASGLFKLQSQGEVEISFPRQTGDGELEAIEWNTTVSYFRFDRVVPLVELNAEFEGLEEDTRSVFAVTPGAVISLTDIAGRSFDLAGGAQIFLGDDREEDFALLLSVRHHWSLTAESTGPPAGASAR